MMASRGAPDVQAEALASFVELAAAARDGALAKAAAEYREAQKAAEEAETSLGEARVAHDARLANIDALDEKLNKADRDLRDREETLAATTADLETRERKLAARTKEIELFSVEIHRRDEALTADEAKLEVDIAKFAADMKAKTKQADATAERIVSKAAAEAARITDAAQAAAEVARRVWDTELAQRSAALEEEMRVRERALKGREDALAAAREEMRRAVAA